MFTLEELKRSMPSTLQSSATEEMLELINKATEDEVIAESIRENFINYTSVLQQGKFRIEDYINAVKYVTFKMYGLSNFDAYVKTFPKRYAKLLAENADRKKISSYVYSYSRGKLVNLILEQSLVPVWVLNVHNYQKAINTQVEIMSDPNNSAHARSSAADSLLRNLAKPQEKAQLNLNIDTHRESSINHLSDAIKRLANQQEELLKSPNVTARDVIHNTVITDGDYEEVNEGEENNE